MFTKVRKQALKLIVAQLIVLFVIFLLWWYLRSFWYALSAALGGAACVLPSIYFVRKVFTDKERSQQKILHDFYVAEAVKLLLSVVLLVLLIKLLPVKLLAALSGYIGAYLAIWFMPLLLIDKERK
ncbi:MAG: ATP synthase subunit I [Gammaproteobacteria bacterium]|nr:ATP synthase subunit I [Gammaproteobacteria bacterium]